MLVSRGADRSKEDASNKETEHNLADITHIIVVLYFLHVDFLISFWNLGTDSSN